jgi:hypothetical protein
VINLKNADESLRQVVEGSVLLMVLFQALRINALEDVNRAHVLEITALKTALADAVLSSQAAADSARADTDEVVEAIQRVVAATPTAPIRATSGAGSSSGGGTGIPSMEADGKNMLIRAPGGKVKLESSQCSIDDLCAVERLDSDGETAIAAIAAVIDALGKFKLE